MLVKTTKRLFKTLAIKVDSVVRRERDWAQLQKMAKTVGIYNQGAEPGGSGWKLLRDGWQSRKACSAGPGLLHPRGRREMQPDFKGGDSPEQGSC